MAREILSDDLTQQQKHRGQRIDRNYHRKPHPWRTCMLWLSWSIPLLCLALMAYYIHYKQQYSIFLPGPVSTSHILFGDRCEACHDQTGTDPHTGRPLWGQVTDAKCLACHDGPLHHDNMLHPKGNTMLTLLSNGEFFQAETATCASCHNEHRGHDKLARTEDRHCTQCHENLTVNKAVTDRAPLFESGIRSFIHGHPEWKVIRDNLKDETPIKFGHAKHLSENVKFPAGHPKAGATMSCIDCHSPDKQGDYMQPISYQMHCAACHPLTIAPDGMKPINLPHGSAELAKVTTEHAFRSFLVESGGKPPKIQTVNPEWEKANVVKRRTIPRFLESEDPRSGTQWLNETVEASLKGMFFPEGSQMASSCLYCHISDGKDEQTHLPLIRKPEIPQVWFKHAIFSHQAHRVLSCNSCHYMPEDRDKPERERRGVEHSEHTSDVLLPGIKDCRICHNHEAGARADCVECHLYHDPKRSNFSGMMHIDQLRQGGLGLGKGIRTYNIVPEEKPAEPARKPEQPKPETPAAKPPEPALETKPEIKPEAPAQATPEVKPAPEVKPEAKPEVVPETKQPEPAAVEVPAVKPEAAAEPEVPAATPTPAQLRKGAKDLGNGVILCRTCGLRWRQDQPVKFCARCGNTLEITQDP